MTTVTQCYKIGVIASRPDAKLKRITVDGFHTYQVWSKGEPVTTPECSPMQAWREAQYHIATPWAPGKPSDY